MALPGIHPAPAAAGGASGPAPPPHGPAAPRALLRRIRRAVAAGVDRVFGAISLALLLSIAVTVPLVQIFALGYLLRAAARVAKTGRLREAFAGVPQASRLGQSALALWVLALPCRLLLSLRDDALLLDPGGPAARHLGVAAFGAGVAAAAAGLLGIYQGGRLGDFARPLRGLKGISADWRKGGAGARAWARIRGFAGAFAIPRSAWLGLRGYLGAGAWLLVPSTLLAVGRDSPLPLVGGALLAAVVVRVPFQQIHFAAHNDLARMFDVQGVMALFARAPLSFLLALAATLLLALPLYLLKIELVPRDALWLPAAVFLVTIFPVKILTALAYHRAARRAHPAHPVVQWLARLLMAPIAIFYAFIVFLTPLTGWHGLLGLYEHHAFLLPVPF
jgi:hypothetical protein